MVPTRDGPVDLPVAHMAFYCLRMGRRIPLDVELVRARARAVRIDHPIERTGGIMGLDTFEMPSNLVPIAGEGP